MQGIDPSGTDWTDLEVDLVVSDYFAMLEMELAGTHYVKSLRNAALQELTRRSKGSIEFKHQNISAVLIKLGLPWIVGYKPMANFQKALIEGIGRFLEAKPPAFPDKQATARAGLAESPGLFLEPPPPVQSGAAVDPPALVRLIQKFDPAERDARNRSLGMSGEESIFHFERNRLAVAGRSDLASRVRWVSQEDGDGAGYDILSFSRYGAERLLEVKTTNGHKTTPFYLSENERSLSVERPEAFRLVRLYDFIRIPKAFEIEPPLDHSVIIRPVNYRASFG